MKSKPLITLTRKQKAFADHLISHPKESATKAALATYGTKGPISPETAKNIASENLTKPNVLIYLEKADSLAQLRITELVSSAKEDIALRASQDVLDRIHGKAVTRAEIKATVVSIGIDLTSADSPE